MAGGVSQGVVPEFKPEYLQKKRKKRAHIKFKPSCSIMDMSDQKINTVSILMELRVYG
jgi:hypothetical protein